MTIKEESKLRVIDEDEDDLPYEVKDTGGECPHCETGTNESSTTVKTADGMVVEIRTCNSCDGHFRKLAD